jgi:hypothetical protein
MIVVQNFSSSFRFLMKTDEPLELRKWNFARRYIIIICFLSLSGLQPSSGYGLHVHEVSWSHTTTRHIR